MKDREIISLNESLWIKGIAIMYMLCHHLLFSQGAVELIGFHYPQGFDKILFQYFRLCVPMFAFLTGWGIAAKNKIEVKYVVKKIVLLYLAYNMVYLTLLPFAIWGGYRPGVCDVILEITGLKRNVMVFCWYVPFYAFGIIILVWMKHFFIKNENILLHGLLGVVFPIPIFYLFQSLCKNEILFDLFNHLMHYYPCISIGYIIFECANRYKEKVNKALNSNTKIKAIVLFVIINFALLIGRSKVTALDFVYGPVLVISLLLLYKAGFTKFERLIKKYGARSEFIWFLHCMIFAAGIGGYIQKWCYAVKNPIAVFLISGVALYFVAVIYEKVFSWMRKWLVRVN